MSWRLDHSLVVCAVVLALALPLARVSAQESFYKGKTIRLIVGLAPGGGIDTYSRIIARHLGIHIPSNSILKVANMAGAASLFGENYGYKASKQSCLATGNFVVGLVFLHIFV